MTDGWWRIKQAAPNAPGGFIVTEIGMPATDSPVVLNAPHGLEITYADRLGNIERIQHFPWASIVHAEYQPPTP